VCHILGDVAALTPEQARTLDNLLKELFASLDEKMALTKHVRKFAEQCEAANINNRLRVREDHWLLAHSLYKRSLSLWVLTEEASTRGMWLNYANDPEGQDDARKTRCEDNLALAAVELGAWKELGASFSLKGYPSEPILTITPKKRIVDWDSLAPDIVGYWTGNRRRADGGGELSEPWARVLRGLAGDTTDDGVGVWLQENVAANAGSIDIRVCVECDADNA